MRMTLTTAFLLSTLLIGGCAGDAASKADATPAANVRASPLDLGKAGGMYALLGLPGSGRTTALQLIALYALGVVNFDPPDDVVVARLRAEEENLDAKTRARTYAQAMSGDLDVASGIADFRLIDPPRVSPQPVFPNRPLLLPLALLAALAGGLAAAFVVSQVRPVFFHPAELRSRFELPILGMVSAVIGDAGARKRRADRLRFLAASGSLVLLFATGMTAMSLISSR